MPTLLPEGSPITVSVIGNPPLLAAGLSAMLEPYAHRVTLVDIDHSPHAGPIDILLYDLPEANAAFDCHAGARHVALWTWETDADVVAAARTNGATGVLSKGLDAKELIDALEDIAAGVWTLANQPQWVPGARTRVVVDHELSERESEVLGRICRGESNQEIADDLFLSINTVKSYIRAVYRKIGVESRSNAVRWGSTHGYAHLETSAPEGDQRFSSDGWVRRDAWVRRRHPVTPR